MKSFRSSPSACRWEDRAQYRQPIQPPNRRRALESVIAGCLIGTIRKDRDRRRNVVPFSSNRRGQLAAVATGDPPRDREAETGAFGSDEPVRTKRSKIRSDPARRLGT